MQQDSGSEFSPSRPVLPEGCGILLYVRSDAPPWRLLSARGDAVGVLGVPRDALREVWSELVHPEDESRLASALAGIPAGESVSLDYRIRTAFGGERWVRDSILRLAGLQAEGVFVGVLRDVSLERTLRAQVAALEERIWRAQRTDSLGGLAAGVAHDLGNLLTAILSAVQMAEEGGQLPLPVQEDLAVARESARRGSEFVKQILRFAAREDYRPGPVNLNDVLENLRIILGRSLGTDIHVSLHEAADLPEIHCDPVQMEQVLLNLAVNAREAMPTGGRLAISTEQVRLLSGLRAEGFRLPPGDYVLLSVTDTGRGIPAHVRDRIFEPFFSTKSRAGTGSGFGLSTVQRVVRGHGGAVVVESEEGEGATFRIYLPVGTASPELPEVDGPSSDLECRGRILVVDDDAAVREVMKRALARERFAVMAVGTARDALHLFERIRPRFDLLVTEVSLPDRPAPDLVRMLRNRAERLPVVCVSGSTTDAVLLTAQALGARYLEKPFTPVQLVETVTRALSAADPRRRMEAEGSTGA